MDQSQVFNIFQNPTRESAVLVTGGDAVPEGKCHYRDDMLPRFHKMTKFNGVDLTNNHSVATEITEDMQTLIYPINAIYL